MQVFKVWPKRIKRGNGQIISPEMVVIVTMRTHSQTPFSNGAAEVKEAYRGIYHCDLSKIGFSANDFNYTPLA